MSKDTGGAAFPRPASEYTKNGSLQDGNDVIRQQDGMTLRDYFAGQALAGLASRGDRPDEQCPRDAYAMADAMLVEKRRWEGRVA